MSVIVRKLDDDDNRLFLLMKGADNVVFERLKQGPDDGLKDMTEMHLSEFANGGLRTLTLAYRVVSGMPSLSFLLRSLVDNAQRRNTNLGVIGIMKQLFLSMSAKRR